MTGSVVLSDHGQFDSSLPSLQSILKLQIEAGLRQDEKSGHWW